MNVDIQFRPAPALMNFLRLSSAPVGRRLSPPQPLQL